jgi:hypothetical protein
VRVLLQVVIGQGRNFDAALAERRDVQPDDVETVEEVFAEPSLRDEGASRSALVAAMTGTGSHLGPHR